MESEQLLRKKDLAMMLRYSERSIMRFVERGQLPKPVYINNQPRWRHSEIEAWLSQQSGGMKS
jgi:predicted DNA-binding transcriptional regulator AlpA